MPQKGRPNNTLHLGEIFDNRMLVLYTEHCQDGDSRYNQAISRLQKFVRSFEI